ncbi:MAG: phosphodiester glycosidase family protein [Cyanobacteria bacterium J06648_16]
MPEVSFTAYDLPQATVYVVTVPTGYRVEVAASDPLQTVEAFADGAIAVLNAGFFDPNNGKTTSHVMIDGAVVADPAENERLVNNPDLTAYLPQILNRSEFRRYDCTDGVRYDIVLHAAPVPEACTQVDAVGAGPQLLPEDTSEPEGFTARSADGELVRDAIGSQQRNARSAVGIKADGTVVLSMVAQKTPTSGLTLEELATFLDRLGVEQALNLDGGSSSALVFRGVAQYGRLSGAGDRIQRPVKSVLMVEREDTLEP